MNKDLEIEGGLKEIIDKWKVAELKPLNIFRLVSDSYHRENLHSDIIAKLLEPMTHPVSIRIFMELLNRIRPGTLSPAPEEYVDAQIHGERDRTDILVELPDKRCVIVENKINNAVDQHNQLSRYFNAAEERGLKVAAVVYLSNDGKKQPEEWAFDDHNRNRVKNVLLKVAAFANKDEDLVNGWLQPLLEEAEKNREYVDLTHLLIQYIAILKEIGEHMMNTHVEKEFLDLLRRDESYRVRAERIANLYNQRLAFVFYELAVHYGTENAKKKYGVNSASSEKAAAFIDVATRSGATVRIGIFDFGNNKIRLSVFATEERGEEALRGLQAKVSEILPKSFADRPTAWYEWPSQEDRLKPDIDRVLQLVSQAR